MENLGKRNLVRILLWFLKSVGLHLPEENTSPIPFHFLLFLSQSIFCVIQFLMYGYVNRNNFNKVVTVTAYLTGNILIQVNLPKLYLYRVEFRKLLEKMDSDFFVYSEGEWVIPDTSSSSWILLDKFYTRKVVLVLGYVILGFGMGSAAPILGVCIAENLFDVRVYPGWYPWRVDSLASLTLTIVIQLFGCVIVFWYYYFLQIILFFFTTEFMRQYVRLCSALSTLEYRVQKLASEQTAHTGEEPPRMVYDLIYRAKLRECFIHYREILSVLNIFKAWFTFFFTTELVLSTLTFTFVFYNVTQIPDPLVTLSLCGSSLVVITSLFGRCLAGEKLSELNRKLMNTIFYDVNWYKQSRQNRNLLLMFHLLAKTRSDQITAFSTFPATFYTFGQLMRISYSYLRLLTDTVKVKKL